MLTYRQPFKGSYPISQYYAESVTSSFHTGIDYACPPNTPILASADGVIRFCGIDKTGYGNCVIIEHDVSHSTLYAHLSFASPTAVGRKVAQGEVIGLSGNSGNSTGPHLHFEARKVWNDYRTHFNPFDLPLMSIDDSIQNGIQSQFIEDNKDLKDASDLPEKVVVVAPNGVYGHMDNFTKKMILYPGTTLNFTGETVERLGLTFCKCTLDLWVAVHDGETQLLDTLDPESKKESRTQ